MFHSNPVLKFLPQGGFGVTWVNYLGSFSHLIHDSIHSQLGVRIQDNYLLLYGAVKLNAV